MWFTTKPVGTGMALATSEVALSSESISQKNPYMKPVHETRLKLPIDELSRARHQPLGIV